MNTEGFGYAQRLGCDVDIFIHATGQATYAAVFNLARDGLHRFKIARRGDREADFHDVDTHSFQRHRDLNLLFHAQAGLQRLFTITQRCIENNDLLAHQGGSLSCLFHAKRVKKNPRSSAGLL
ncbi:hypothetical protein D3C78_1002350 [compost metagenome]